MNDIKITLHAKFGGVYRQSYLHHRTGFSNHAAYSLASLNIYSIYYSTMK